MTSTWRDYKPPQDRPATARAAVDPRHKSNSKNARGMNGWEERYSAKLDLALYAGAIRGWWFEATKFRLASRTWYLPDFLVEYTDGHLEAHEVKGFWRDDARVKVKVFAKEFPWLRVSCWRRDSKGMWVAEYITNDRS